MKGAFMETNLLLTGSILLIGFILILLLLPKVLRLLGYHPNYNKTAYKLNGKKALIITTSHDTLGESGKTTGVYGSEMTIPYYEFLEAGMTVDIASIKGSKVPIESKSMKYPLASHADQRYLKDSAAQNKVNNSLKIDNIDFLEYDIIFMAGGWGAAYDLGTSEVLGQKITEANAKDILLGSVCHGVLGFRLAEETNGKPLVEDKIITGVSDKQIQELKIESTPLHPETELRKQHANYQSATAFKDTFATLVVIDGNIVTGQNQNSGGETAQTLLRLLAEQQ